MALEGTSASVGATPIWLEKCVDIRTMGFSEKDGRSVLHLKAPTLGEAAPKLFEQDSLFPSVASPNDTALQILNKIAQEVRRENPGSDLYDSSLLKKFSQWKTLFEGELHDIEFPDTPNGLIDISVAENAKVLNDQTPPDAV